MPVGPWLSLLTMNQHLEEGWPYLTHPPAPNWLHLGGMLQSTLFTAKTDIGAEVTWLQFRYLMLCFPAANHSTYAADVNLHPGGKQSTLQEGFMHGKGLLQPMSFPLEYRNNGLAGKRVLQEARALVLECPTTHSRAGRDAGGG